MVIPLRKLYICTVHHVGISEPPYVARLLAAHGLPVGVRIAAEVAFARELERIFGGQAQVASACVAAERTRWDRACIAATAAAAEYSDRPPPNFQSRKLCRHPRQDVLQAVCNRGKREIRMKSIEIVAPTEDVGRETISRFDMQFQAAAFAALEILEGKGIDCVYCDLHDDFVVRRQEQGNTTYHFFQVKTKKKLHHQWDLAEIFAFKKRGQNTDADSLEKVRKSFGGKLLLHGIVFDDACREVTLLSNVHFDEDVVTTIEQLRGRAPASKAAKFLAEHFCAIFEITPSLPETKTGELLAKLSLNAGVAYMAPDRDAFASAARSAIHKYSEIDLTYHETNELANGLVDLVFRKSRTPLASVSPADITSLAGVQLDNLLEVLSISRSVYNALAAGEEPKALRSASVLQRCLKAAGASDPMIEFAALQKVNWDVWLRSARHIYSPFDLALLLEFTDQLYDTWVRRGAEFAVLRELLEDATENALIKKFAGLQRDLLFGAVSSVVVRRYSR